MLLLDSVLSVVLFGFNAWNWYLALFGKSQIEFWGDRSGRASIDFNFKNPADNIFKTFGTYSIIRMFSPSLRSLPFTGVEWSYKMKDLGFNEQGDLEVNKKKPVKIAEKSYELEEKSYEMDDLAAIEEEI